MRDNLKKYGLNDLREMFLKFFEEKGHLRLGSFPLIPKDDPSLLLINSGMAPMKSWFTGDETPPNLRVCTCQKCIRTGDIENVGKTARHGTYFEMLGNFSFGDYFKREAIAWCWEFLTERVGLPPDRLYPSVYLEDNEAFGIWKDDIRIDPARIVKLGKADNFWEHGEGPCGPCSEVYFDRGIENGCGAENCAPGCDCDRFVEIWNNVFTQFDSDGKGNYTELSQKNIDTGMGLERLAAVCQGVSNLFEVDTVVAIIRKISKLSGVEYAKDPKSDVSIRVITDHIRSATMMICDGVMPTNEGRGYVLRKLLRRAARHGRLLGIDGVFLCDLCGTVIDENAGAYPELTERAAIINRTIRSEEEKFGKTVGAGMAMLTELIAGSDKVLSGVDAFRLYDTYGFPLDLTVEILEENGMEVDKSGFDAAMEEQRNRARSARAALGETSWKSGERVDEDYSEDDLRAISRAHSATHLLHAVLRDLLGDHATQAGSLVEPDKLRFDFNHHSALSKDEIASVEDRVNAAVLEGHAVSAVEMPIEEAKAMGALALFSEKYENVVRVVKMGDISTELCGGTHIENTAMVGSFSITSEFSVASGTRRIEAVCGHEVLALLRNTRLQIVDLESKHKADLREMKSKLTAQSASESKGKADDLLNSAKSVGDTLLITAIVDNPDILKPTADTLRDKNPNIVAVLAAEKDGKITIAATCGKQAVSSGVKAGDLIREVTKLCGGSGGGKPDFAMGGGKDVSKLQAALDAVENLVKGAIT